MRRAGGLLLLVATLAGCATTPPSVGSLAGEWHGRVSTPRGHTTARLTIAPDGRYEGTAYFDGLDRPLHGAIVTLPSGLLRYVSSERAGPNVDSGHVRRRRRRRDPGARLGRDAGDCRDRPDLARAAGGRDRSGITRRARGAVRRARRRLPRPAPRLSVPRWWSRRLSHRGANHVWTRNAGAAGHPGDRARDVRGQQAARDRALARQIDERVQEGHQRGRIGERKGEGEGEGREALVIEQAHAGEEQEPVERAEDAEGGHDHREDEHGA